MRIIINKADLFSAFEMNSISSLYYLNINDGSFKVIFDKDIYDIDENFDGPIDNIDSDSELWQQVPLEKSWEGYNRMVSFIDSLEDSHLKSALSNVIHKSRPFRRFKDIMLNYPSQREDSFNFENSEREKKAITWIKELEKQFTIEIELK